MSTLEIRRIVGEMILYMEFFETHSALEEATEEDCHQLIKDAKELWDFLTRTKERKL